MLCSMIHLMYLLDSCYLLIIVMDFDALTMQATWAKLVHGREKDDSKPLPPLPPRLVTDNDLKEFYEAMKVYEVSNSGMTSTNGAKRKPGYAGSLDTEHYGRGKRAREVCLFSLFLKFS